jgi:hypothetical protein
MKKLINWYHKHDGIEILTVGSALGLVVLFYIYAIVDAVS